MPFFSLKRLALCLAFTGVAGTISVLAAPKGASKSKTPPAPPVAKSPKNLKAPGAGKSTGTKKVTPPAKTNVMRPTTATGTGTDTTQTQISTDETEFTPSRYPGVMVRNVPGPPPTPPTVDTSNGPVVLSEHPAPGGGTEAIVQFPPEVFTLDPKNQDHPTIQTLPAIEQPVEVAPGTRPVDAGQVIAPGAALTGKKTKSTPSAAPKKKTIAPKAKAKITKG